MLVKLSEPCPCLWKTPDPAQEHLYQSSGTSKCFSNTRLPAPFSACGAPSEPKRFFAGVSVEVGLGHQLPSRKPLEVRGLSCALPGI